METKNNFFTYSASVFLPMVVFSIFYMYIYIVIRVLICELYTYEDFMFREIITALFGFVSQNIVYFLGRKWQKKILRKKIPLKATPFYEQIPYYLAFIVLYVISSVTFEVINELTHVEYFSRFDPSMSMNYVIGNALIIRSWEVYARIYSEQRNFGDTIPN